jgi:hypothetical protein
LLSCVNRQVDVKASDCFPPRKFENPCRQSWICIASHVQANTTSASLLSLLSKLAAKMSRADGMTDEQLRAHHIRVYCNEEYGLLKTCLRDMSLKQLKLIPDIVDAVLNLETTKEKHYEMFGVAILKKLMTKARISPAIKKVTTTKDDIIVQLIKAINKRENGGDDDDDGDDDDTLSLSKPSSRVTASKSKKPSRYDDDDEDEIVSKPSKAKSKSKDLSSMSRAELEALAMSKLKLR